MSEIDMSEEFRRAEILSRDRIQIDTPVNQRMGRALSSDVAHLSQDVVIVDQHVLVHEVNIAEVCCDL